MGYTKLSDAFDAEMKVGSVAQCVDCETEVALTVFVLGLWDRVRSVCESRSEEPVRAGEIARCTACHHERQRWDTGARQERAARDADLWRRFRTAYADNPDEIARADMERAFMLAVSDRETYKGLVKRWVEKQERNPRRRGSRATELLGS